MPWPPEKLCRAIISSSTLYDSCEKDEGSEVRVCTAFVSQPLPLSNGLCPPQQLASAAISTSSPGSIARSESPSCDVSLSLCCSSSATALMRSLSTLAKMSCSCATGCAAQLASRAMRSSSDMSCDAGAQGPVLSSSASICTTEASSHSSCCADMPDPAKRKSAADNSPVPVSPLTTNLILPFSKCLIMVGGRENSTSIGAPCPCDCAGTLTGTEASTCASAGSAGRERALGKGASGVRVPSLPLHDGEAWDECSRGVTALER
mmetsp:Transcript_54295/g.79623  ORF Transcript_54295/g.79623 Transcript_54295/m.79623 type:complete len:263 (-) Transcript_54295:568-1356(-)